MAIPPITFDSVKKVTSENAERLMYIHGVPDDGTRALVIGIDPGVNFGITLIHDKHIGVCHGNLKRETQPGRYSVRAFRLLEEFDIMHRDVPCIIEGAAYHKQFGQVGLAEVRIGFYLSAVLLGYKVFIVPPATIRKKVFNDSKQQAGDIWPQLNHNAADSLSIALYGI